MRNVEYIPGRFFELHMSDLADLPLRQAHVRMYGRLIPEPRLTAWFGEGRYMFGGTARTGQAFPALLECIRQDVSEIAGVEFNSCLANLYRGGSDSVSWHSDDEKEMGPVIASVSLGATRRFLLRPKGAKTPVTEYHLGHGDLVIMSGDLQTTHEHSVPKTRIPTDPRLNLTFRVLV